MKEREEVWILIGWIHFSQGPNTNTFISDWLIDIAFAEFMSLQQIHLRKTWWCKHILLKLWTWNKLGCVFPMVVVSILRHAEFASSDHSTLFQQCVIWEDGQFDYISWKIFCSVLWKYSISWSLFKCWNVMESWVILMKIQLNCVMLQKNLNRQHN